MVDLYESQKVVHAVMLPLKGLMVSLGNLTLWVGGGAREVAAPMAPLSADVDLVTDVTTPSILIRVE